jgi:hypothetical protein
MSDETLEQASISRYPSEDALESFVMGQMQATDHADLIFHVSTCAECSEKLLEAFDYVEAIRIALNDMKGPPESEWSAQQRRECDSCRAGCILSSNRLRH